MSFQIQTPKGQKEIQAPSQKYDLSILDLPEDVISQFMSIFDCDNVGQLCLTLLNNNLLVEEARPIVSQSRFVDLVNRSKKDIDEIGMKHGSNFSTLTKSQVVVNLITSFQIFIELTPKSKFKPQKIEVVKSVPTKFKVKDIAEELKENPAWMELKPIVIDLPVDTKYPQEQIDLRRKFIYDKTRELWYSDESEFLSGIHLKSLCQLYDAVFFGGLLEANLRRTHSFYKFNLSSNKPHSGSFKTRGNAQIITINWGLFKKLFPSGTETYTSNGVTCHNRLEAVQVTLEHELIHLLTRLSPHRPTKIEKNDPVHGPHGSFFRELVLAYFGHTDIKHGFHVANENRKTMNDFKLNQIVQFTNDNGTVTQGKIVKLTFKKARVQNEDNQQWNVPYNLLTAV